MFTEDSEVINRIKTDSNLYNKRQAETRKFEGKKVLLFREANFVIVRLGIVCRIWKLPQMLVGDFRYTFSCPFEPQHECFPNHHGWTLFTDA